MNSFIEVNLSEHFYDPDGDELTFFVREPENVSVEIWKGIALLTPETNFYGVNYLTFYGEDPLGAQVNSSEVTVIVTYESQHLVWYVLYLPYILLGLVIVLVLIILAFIQRAKSE